MATSKEWEGKVEQITVRVPKGARAKLIEYVNQKAKEDEENPRYSVQNKLGWQPSLNSLIKALLEEETGIDLSGKTSYTE